MKQFAIAPITTRSYRMSTKLREAIALRVSQGLNIKEACKQAGISETGYHKAMKRPAVKDFYQEAQRKFVTDVEARRATYKARAFEVAADLMEHAKSESVRARMAEFLANEGKSGNTVNVHVDARQTGYEYIRPGQRIVEIEPDCPTP